MSLSLVFAPPAHHVSLLASTAAMQLHSLAYPVSLTCLIFTFEAYEETYAGSNRCCPDLCSDGCRLFLRNKDLCVDQLHSLHRWLWPFHSDLHTPGLSNTLNLCPAHRRTSFRLWSTHLSVISCAYLVPYRHQHHPPPPHHPARMT
ncbi:hypothetical protein CTAM01_04728 [Colletotrichum tamarilloi]|uniref:Secreted protein n=1 Tax=Colletotrichum tamarilloi TaxID=1209934 RepID=A0ABQ9RH01_9PEZI|nr:uncharacterized protein CTAM01_04728 [Colletotrichum tamarilloi]KAK1503416.1 hypothetical protein CTAM01_04728 [Colletotrichum tamarilloi]